MTKTLHYIVTLMIALIVCFLLLLRLLVVFFITLDLFFELLANKLNSFACYLAGEP